MRTAEKNQKKDQYRPGGRLLAGLMIVTVTVLVGLLYYLPYRDSDVWFHLAYARYFIENLTLIPDHTVFSWSPADNSRIYCTWLADLVLYGIHRVGGDYGLFFLRYLCMFFFVLAVWLYARKMKVLTEPTTWLLCLIGVLLSFVAGYCKPEIFTYVLMTSVCWLWWHVKVTEKVDSRLFYLFPILMLIWVNSHGGVIFGYVFLFAVGFGELLNTIFDHSSFNARTRIHLFSALILSGIMLLATPYGLNYPLSLFQRVMPSGDNLSYNATVAAFQSPFVISGARLNFGHLAILSLVLLVVLSLPLIRSKKVDGVFLLSNLFFAVIFARYIRATFCWAPVFVFSGLYLVGQKPITIFPSKKSLQLLVNLMVSVLFVFVSVRAGYDAIHRPLVTEYFGLERGSFSPFDETDFIEKHYSRYRLANTYEEGAYLLWKLWPEQKVLIDARHFPYRAWSQEFFSFIGSPEQSSFLVEHPADLWLVNMRHLSLLKWFHRSPDWNMAYWGKTAILFVRKGLPVFPVSRGEFSQMVSEMKNSEIALQAFQFGVAIGDWERADLILGRMKELRWWPENSWVPDGAGHYRDAVIAFRSHDFKKAIQLLADDEVAELSPDSDMLLMSHVYLGVKAWESMDDERALAYFELATLVQSEVNVHYNVGIIGGYLAYINGEIEDEKNEGWKAHLNKFLQAERSEKVNLDRFRLQAEQMLKGRFQGRPDILVPAFLATD